tara:strand:- start:4952 stop:5188 length:237 start_codon:yes stop_codon:yes gene_type:complete
MSRGRPLALVDITYEELGEYVGRKGLVKVSKAWLVNLTGDFEPCSEVASDDEVREINEEVAKEIVPKIEYKLTDLNDE